MISETIIDNIFLIPLFIIGILCCYSDFRYGKIKNIFISLGFLWVIISYIFLFLYTQFIIHQPNNLVYLLRLLLNGGMTLLTGFIFWYFNLWAAGDAKLFTIISLLLPLKFYSKFYLPYFPSFLLLLNTFVILILFLLIQALIKTSYNLLKNFTIKEIIKNLSIIKISFAKIKSLITSILQRILMFFFLASILKLLSTYLQGTLKLFVTNPLIVFPLFLLINHYVFRPLRKYKFFIIFLTIINIGIVIILFTIFENGIAVILKLLETSLVYMLAVNLTFILLDLYIEKYEIETIAIENLKPGKCIIQNDVIKIKQLLKQSSDINFNNSDGLTQTEVDAIKTAFKDNPAMTISIYRTFPFAPFMLLAVCLTMITHNSLLNIIWHLFIK